MRFTLMRKILSSVIVAIFFGQSLLTSYMYAADVPAKPTEQTSQSVNQALIDGLLKTDVSTASAISILQIAAYIYVYEKNGIAWFDFDKGDDSQAMMWVNYFISLYAPNIWFLANDKWDKNYFSDKAELWKTKHPAEYTKVYAYAKDTQLKYNTPAATTTPAPTKPTPVPAKSTPVEKATKFGESCDVMYAKLMKEYESIIAIKDVDYTKIADVKKRISEAQEGKECTVAAAVATQQDMQKANQEIVAQVRKDLNFGSANMKVIPDNIVPAYCKEWDNVLRNQLSDIDGQMIKSMKTDLDSLIQSEEFKDSSIKRSVLKFVSQELWIADSTQSTQQWDDSSAFHNMAQWLMLVGDSMVNTRWIYSMIDIANTNIDKFNEIGRFIWEEFDGVKSLKNKGNADYNWDANIGTFVRTANADGVIRFKLPATKDATKNNATFTLATAKSKSIQVSEKPYTWTEYAWDISLEQFAQEAKNNWSQRGNQIDASTLGSDLTKKIIAYAPDYYTYNDPKQPTVFFAEANGEQKVFLDANLTNLMPAGKFSNPRWTTYVIGENGRLDKMYYYEEVPESIRAKLEVDGKLVAGVDLTIAYDEDSISKWYGSSFPLKINARVYIADYLITFNASRVLKNNAWSLNANLNIQWPTICKLSLSAKIDYTHDGEQWLPSIEELSTNITKANVVLDYNQNNININIDDVAWFVSSVSAITSTSMEWDDPSVLITPINQYVAATYFFAGNKIADIRADIDSMVVIQYINNGLSEPIMDVVWSYLYLVRMDVIMNFVWQYLGWWEEAYYDQTPDTSWDEEKKDYVKIDYEPVLKVNSYYQDGDYLYASHIYYDADSNGSDIQPDKVSIEVTSASWTTSYPLELFDIYTYRAPLSYILTDPSVDSAYIYAAYNGYTSTYYIIEPTKWDAWDTSYGSWWWTWDKSWSGYDYWTGNSWSGYEEPKNLYTIQWQSTLYQDVATQEFVMSLYDDGLFVQYVEPTMKLSMTYGQDCLNTPAMCTYSGSSIYPTYLDGIPTYIIDTMQFDDTSVYESIMHISYKDPLWYEHNEKYVLKNPTK